MDHHTDISFLHLCLYLLKRERDRENNNKKGMALNSWVIELFSEEVIFLVVSKNSIPTAIISATTIVIRVSVQKYKQLPNGRKDI